jgi:lipoprotein-anchoring transpeptidase ErfK/SrfK
MRHKTFTTFTLFAVLAAAGCGGAAKPRAAPKPSAATPPTAPSTTNAPRTCASGTARRLGSAKLAFAAIVRTHAAVAARPGGRAFAHFGRLNQNGVPTIFSARGVRLDRRCRPSAYLVQIPQRPNGVTGWVPARQVDVERVTTRIVVDLSQKRVTLFRRGRRVLSSTAAIGSPATPTPTGSFYVNQRLIPSDPHGPFGPGAVGISAFSNVLTGWVQGGPIAIHGTNEPWSIGKAVSNGCIRLPNRVLRKVFAQALNGTPVLIRR